MPCRNTTPSTCTRHAVTHVTDAHVGKSFNSWSGDALRAYEQGARLECSLIFPQAASSQAGLLCKGKSAAPKAGGRAGRQGCCCCSVPAVERLQGGGARQRSRQRQRRHVWLLVLPQHQLLQARQEGGGGQRLQRSGGMCARCNAAVRARPCTQAAGQHAAAHAPSRPPPWMRPRAATRLLWSCRSDRARQRAGAPQMRRRRRRRRGPSRPTGSLDPTYTRAPCLRSVPFLYQPSQKPAHHGWRAGGRGEAVCGPAVPALPHGAAVLQARILQAHGGLACCVAWSKALPAATQPRCSAAAAAARRQPSRWQFHVCTCRSLPPCAPAFAHRLPAVAELFRHNVSCHCASHAK